MGQSSPAHRAMSPLPQRSKEAVEDRPVVHTRHAEWFVREHRPDRLAAIYWKC
jgi:hypothetical protein